MKYYYQLDKYNRFTCLEKENGIVPEKWNWPYLELENTNNIIIGQHGFINNQIVFVGIKDEELIEGQKGDKLQRISYLKNKLNEGDYKIIKCYEAQLGSEDMPYDLIELLTERKAWRDEINQLEFQIAMLG